MESRGPGVQTFISVQKSVVQTTLIHCADTMLSGCVVYKATIESHIANDNYFQ
jgi:hypothetical protein